MPIYEDHLKHWGLGKGEKASNHKYYAREEVNSGNQKYKYFYTKSAFDKFKSGVKGIAQEVKSNWETGAKTIANKTKSATSTYKAGLKELSNVGKEFVDNYRVGLGIKKKQVSYDKPIGPKNVRASSPVINYGSMNVPDRVKNYTHKYVKKVKLANGKTRYFYSEKQYKRWAEIQKYQRTEPDYLKDLPETEPSWSGQMPTREQDIANVNKTGNSGEDPNRWVNCIYCSLAYEYRRRGYDVESISKKSDSTYTDLNDWFNGIDIRQKAYIVPKEDRDLIEKYGGVEADKVIYRSITNDDHTKSMLNVEPIKNYQKAYGKLPNYEEKGKLIETYTLKKMSDFPNGSRGFVAMYWEQGSGHSIAFEKDNSGKVHFIDTQLNKEIDFSKYAQDFKLNDETVITRTDDLEIAKDSMKYIEPIK